MKAMRLTAALLLCCSIEAWGQSAGRLASTPRWVNFGFWPQADQFFLVDARLDRVWGEGSANGGITRQFPVEQALAAASQVTVSGSSLNALYWNDGQGGIPEAGIYEYTYDQSYSSLSAPKALLVFGKNKGRRSTDPFGAFGLEGPLQLCQVYRFEKMGSGFFVFGEFCASESNGAFTGFAFVRRLAGSLDIQGCAAFPLEGDTDTNFYTTFGLTNYLTVLSETQAAFLQVSNKPVVTLCERKEKSRGEMEVTLLSGTIPHEYANSPVLQASSGSRGSAKAVKFAHLIQQTAMPTDLLASDGELFVVVKSEFAANRDVVWELVSLGLKSREFRRVLGGLTAPNLTIIPGRRSFVAIQKGPIASLPPEDEPYMPIHPEYFSYRLEP